MTATVMGATIEISRDIWDRTDASFGRATQSNIERELGMTGFEEDRRTNAMAVPS
jgi:hypothetical protein